MAPMAGRGNRTTRRGRSWPPTALSALGRSASIPPSFLRTTIPGGFSRGWATCFGRGQPIPTSTIFVPSSSIDPESKQNRGARMTTRFRIISLALLALAGLIASAVPAAADFRLCNNTSSRVGIAIGYKDKDGWTTEGWWNLASRSCETLLRGTLVARFYYIYAVDYDRGGEWSGQAFMCTRDKEFTVRGTEDCLARGYDRTGFFEVDTSEQQSWTVQLTDTNEQSHPLAPNQPLLTIPPSGQQQTPARPVPGGAPK